MRKWLIIPCFIAIFLIFGVTHSYAVGIGGYVVLGGGDTKQKTASNAQYLMLFPGQLPVSYPSHYNNIAVGGGFILDSACASLDVFNFRLKIGAEQNKISRESDLKLIRMHLDAIFGLAPVRTKYIRWWLGPLIGGRYTMGDNVGNISSIRYYGGAAGVATGVNINMGEHFTLGLELGFKYGMEWGSQKWNPLYNIIAMSASMNKDLKLRGWEIYGSASAMFRTGNDSISKIRYTETKQ